MHGSPSGTAPVGSTHTTEAGAVGGTTTVHFERRDPNNPARRDRTPAGEAEAPAAEAARTPTGSSSWKVPFADR